ncbi:MAG: DUF2975 domain-containing protein [Oscillospiraceae bacterium]|nr:DUF2975 domain-containing protein [Oscillospiraceae bacterium]
MTQSNLSKWLKAIIIGTGLFGLAVFGLLVPRCGYELTVLYPEFADRFWPWLCFLWLCAVPCFVSLVFAWKIAANIGKDHSFSFENSSHLKVISALAAGDSAFFLLGNVALLFLDMNHPGVLLVAVPLVVFVGAAVSVVCAALSHLVYKSAVLQSESDLTI